MALDSSTVPPSRQDESGFRLHNLRWYICGLLFFASTINYVDRQTVSVLKPHLQNLLHWSEVDYGWIVFYFQLAYAIVMVASGKLIDKLGTRAGFALAMVWWSLAAMAHALCRTVSDFEIARFFLGAGEAANFPASIKSVAEWFPKRERALATGIFNSGTNIGALVGTSLVAYVTLQWSWPAAFIITGSLGLVWLVFWLLLYQSPERHRWITKPELQYIDESESAPAEESLQIPWTRIFAYRQAWGFILAKFMTDPIWWFYIFWLPSYLEQSRGFSLKQIGFYAWIPFFAASFGSTFGGWLSGFLLRRGWTINAGRKCAMLSMAILMPAGIAAVLAPKAWMAIALISVAMAAHQGWSANVFTLASDIFPKKAVGSVVGLGGAAGAFGGLIIAPLAGYTLQWTHSYIPLFIIAGVMHPAAIALVQITIPRIRPLQAASIS
jgi:MFS transporter, ACS family, aldohexuronate transporter